MGSADPATRGAMRRAGLRAAVVLLGCAALTLVGCASAPEPEPEPVVPLTVSEAGGVYLSAVCPLNDAWDAVDLEVDRLRLVQARGDDVESVGAPLERALKDLAEASRDAADKLNPKTQSWPAGAKAAVTGVRESILDDRKEIAEVAKLDTEKALSVTWKGASEAASTAAEARVALELPEDSSSACAQWDEQQAEQQAEQQREQHDDAQREQQGGSQGEQQDSKQGDSKSEQQNNKQDDSQDSKQGK